jgi:hypothetical protein
MMEEQYQDSVVQTGYLKKFKDNTCYQQTDTDRWHTFGTFYTQMNLKMQIPGHLLHRLHNMTLGRVFSPVHSIA